MANDTSDLSGTWFCWHWYPSKDDSAEDVTKNRMHAQRRGRQLVLESEPTEDGSYMFVRLSVDDDVVTGTWQETTSQSGDFHAATYSGAGQLILSEDKQTMEGKWAGAGYDHKAKKTRIYTGRWKIARTE